MKVTIKIDQAAARRTLGDKLPEIMLRAAGRVGAVVKSQAQKRFDDSGDEEGAWPDLWVNGQGVFNAMKAQRGERADKAQRAAEGRAQVAYERVLDKIDAGKLTGVKAIQAKRRARAKWRMARAGIPEIHRRGGEPLRDTGALYQSIRQESVKTPNGAQAVVGSPLAHGLYQQNGIKTKGPNFIPITARAKNGWNAKLVPGWDYVMAWNGVKVPPRVWMRFTNRNKRDIRETFAAVNQ